MKHHKRKALNRRRSPDLYWRRRRPGCTPMRWGYLRMPTDTEHRLVKYRLGKFSEVLAAPYGETPPYHVAPSYILDPYQEISRLTRTKK